MCFSLEISLTLIQYTNYIPNTPLDTFSALYGGVLLVSRNKHQIFYLNFKGNAATDNEFTSDYDKGEASPWMIQPGDLLAKRMLRPYN